MFKKFYVVAIDEEKLISAIRKLNELNIKVIELYELAGENEGIWALGFKASEKHFKSFLGFIRVERVILKK